VVAVGGGFGGLQAAVRLRHAPVELTLVDRRNFHLFQPLTYQVATGALSPGEIAYPLLAIFKRNRNVRVIRARLRSRPTPPFRYRDKGRGGRRRQGREAQWQPRVAEVPRRPPLLPDRLPEPAARLHPLDDELRHTRPRRAADHRTAPSTPRAS